MHKLYLWAALLLLAILNGLLIVRLHLHPVLAWITSVNLITFALFGIDKLAAMGKFLRVPEWVLYLFAFVGGSPGAIAAQSAFRHKVSKPAFLRIFWLIVAMQILLIAGVIWGDLLKILY